MDSPAGGARGGRGGGGRGRGAFSRGGAPGSGPPRGPAADRPRGGGGSGAMRGNPRRDPVGTRAPRTTYQPPGRRPGGPHINEGPTVEVRVEGWRESKGGADECISFLERKTKMTFKKVRLKIQIFFLFFIRLLSLSSATSICGYIVSSSAIKEVVFFCTATTLASFWKHEKSCRKLGAWPVDFWRFFIDITKVPRIAWRIVGIQFRIQSTPLRKKAQTQKRPKKTSKKRNSCENNPKQKWKAEMGQNNHFPSFLNAPSFSYHADSKFRKNHMLRRYFSRTM